jgi:LacI family transcriptional regulator
MPRLQDVAELAEVSLFSASKVMSGTWREARIGAACAERVQAAARKLGYSPNYHARSLMRRRSQTLGLVLRDPAHSDAAYGGALIHGVQEHLSSREHDLLIIGRRGGSSEIAHAIDCMRQGRVDALIVPGELGEMIWTAEFEAAKGVIVLAVEKPGSTHPAVDIDPVPGIVAAVRHLHELGHREILWLEPALPLAAVTMRRQAFKDATTELRIRGVVSSFSAPAIGDLGEAARRHGAGILARPFPFTAVMGFNDATAIGLCRAANDLALVVPRDLSVVGFDDFQCAMAVPRLTTVSHELAAIGERVAELAIALIEDPKLRKGHRGRVERIPARLIVRDSTARPPQRRGAQL